MKRSFPHLTALLPLTEFASAAAELNLPDPLVAQSGRKVESLHSQFWPLRDPAGSGRVGLK